MAKKDETQILTKMSVATLGLKGTVGRDGQTFLCRIYGEVNGTKAKEFNGRTSIMFLGQFNAVDEEGTEFTSEKLYLPGGVSESLEAAVEKSMGEPVKFGYDIYSGPSEKSPVGYVYSAKVVIKTEQSNRLAEMSKELGTTPLPKNAKKPAAK